MNAPSAAGIGGVPVISRDSIRKARAALNANGARLIEALEEEAGLPAAEFTAALARTLYLDAAGMGDLHRMTPAFDLLPYADVVQRECVLLRSTDAGNNAALVMAFADPFDDTVRPWAEERVGRPIRWLLAHRADIAAYLARHEETMRAMDGMVAATDAPAGAADGINELSLRTISEDTSPVVKLVHSTLYDALKAGVSDIHLETGPDALVIKYRIDGVLSQVGGMPGLDIAEQVISRIKVMSELDIGERRIPQDGRFRVSTRGRQIDLRVSIMPSIHGEDAVLRILDKEALSDHL
jgi:general secretion pathway protein E